MRKAAQDFQRTAPDQRLILAARQGNIETAQALLDEGVNINQIYEDETPLVTAIARNKDAFVEFLLEQPNIAVNVRVGRPDYDTPLTKALLNRNIPIIEMLLQHGADPNIPNVIDLPLDLAFFDLDLIDLLIRSGADVNALNPQGLTPLMVAIQLDVEPAFNVLLGQQNADLDAYNKDGLTALMLASALPHGYTYVDKLLILGADPLLLSSDGRTARQYASNDRIARLLMGAEQEINKAEVAATKGLNNRLKVARKSKVTNEAAAKKSEYDNLCKGLKSNLNKPGVVALAKSLNIKTSNKTKIQLCDEISQLLTI